MDNFYQSIELTPDEIEAALLEGKKRKFFHLRNREYWERLKPPKGEIEEMIIPAKARKGYESISL